MCALYEQSGKPVQTVEITSAKSGDFVKLQESLVEWAHQNGILLDDLPKTLEKSAERFSRNLEKYRTTDTSRFAFDYRTRVMDLLQANDGLFGKLAGDADKKEAESKDESSGALEIISWQNTQISAAISRAYTCLAQQYNASEHESCHPEYNGHAKLALLCIDECYPAWEVLMRKFPFIESECWSLLVLLEKIKSRLKADFPNAMQFIRPGLDESN